MGGEGSWEVIAVVQEGLAWIRGGSGDGEQTFLHIDFKGCANEIDVGGRWKEIRCRLVVFANEED